ncbi:TPA: response regulator transcription factor [Streptococcus equi subsp. zooepidemicus]|uniref:response regulator transcription factor n=1 Tax=Streptococcus equi TaxID=1336 RepID=UPI000319BF07|nr:LytTR family DNA-binding domain-containing protein [Streptococcus equi]KIQ75577.1 transcriptional regulator [Streptococcus equi subsp. zooepidemicus]MCD3414228.1 LytTR family DNA-binding domain-containing protein [Streptococcus equi subsp. zooepidemicus]MCD3423494.1 LytTR family DNA-binding domain-containing protein [Streptococcus equi subsp. zooepidemicus]MCD3423496.1 LytTR family DNA-binding domain-containing protein [Streptococcus equi subsp. zooepidemicus]MCD3423500.1 LytTR family DNA-b
MLNIFILEDNLIQQSRIEAIVASILEEGRIPHNQLEVFSNPQKLFDSIQERGDHQLYFLDIEIGDQSRSGLELASDIRQKDPNAVLVFVTTHSEFAPISFRYKVSALDFIDKAVDSQQFKERIEECIRYTYEMMSSRQVEEMFLFETPQTRLKLPYKDILYFATATTPHKVCLWTQTERLEFYGNLSEIHAVAPKLFLCHRSYLVNLDNVVRIDKAKQLVYFENGDSCMVSRLRMKQLFEKWKSFR